MVDGTSTDDRDGLRTLMQAYDGAYVPRFEVYVGPNDTPATDGRVLEHEQAIEEEKNRINNRIFRQTTTTSQPTTQQLIPLTGVYGQHPEKGRRNDVRSVEFTESVGHEGQLAQVRVEVHNVYDPRTQRYYYTDRVEDDDFDPILQTGRALALRMGYHGSIEPVFEGIITEVELEFPADGEPTATVTAVDKRDLLRTLRPRGSDRQRVGSEEEFAAKLVQQGNLRLAARRGQRTEVNGPIRLPRDQDVCTFLTDRARRATLELSAFGNTVFMLRPGDASPPMLRYRYREGLISFRPSFNTSGCHAEIVVRARTSDGRRFRVSATAEDLVRQGLIPEGESALSALQRSSERARVEEVTDLVFTSESEAREYAVSTLKYQLSRMFTAHGELVGDPRVRAGTCIEIAGVGRFDGTYYVTSVTHSFGDNGYQTGFEARRSLLPSQGSTANGGRA